MKKRTSWAKSYVIAYLVFLMFFTLSGVSFSGSVVEESREDAID